VQQDARVEDDERCAAGPRRRTVRADPFRISMLSAADHPGDEVPVLRVADLVVAEGLRS